MAREYSEIATPEDIRRTADEAVSQDTGARVVAREINALERTQNRAVDASFFADVARESLLNKPLSELKLDSYRRQAALKSREALRALKAGDLKRAAALKRQELYQMCLAMEAKKLVDAQKRALKLYGRIKGRKEIKGVETRYLVMTQVLLAAAHARLSETLTRDAVTIADFLDECMDKGEVPPVIATDLADRLRATKDYKSMGTSLAVELESVVRQLMKLGKGVNTVRVNDETQSLKDVTDGLKDAIKDNAQAHGREVTGDMEEVVWKSKVKEATQLIGLSHARIPSLPACIEGGRFGRFFDAIVKPADKASEHKEVLKQKFAKRLDKVFKPLERKMGKKLFFTRAWA